MHMLEVCEIFSHDNKVHELLVYHIEVFENISLIINNRILKDGRRVRCKASSISIGFYTVGTMTLNRHCICKCAIRRAVHASIVYNLWRVATSKCQNRYTCDNNDPDNS